MIPLLITAVLVAFGASALLCLLALQLFPWFRSGERKEGHFRPDQSTGSYRIEKGKGLLKRASRTGSNELPLVGGPAIMLAITAAAAVAGIIHGLNPTQWALLGILVVAMLGYGAVGFVDDWRKVHRGEGISEIQKAAGVIAVSLVAAAALNRLIVSPRLSARLAYPPYTDLPVLGNVLLHQHFAWIIFFLLMTTVVASATSLAVDFSDGMDGLSGGLLLSAALAFAAILIGEGAKDLWAPTIAVLALAGGLLGYLPFNWPSSWKARNQGRGKRRAVLIMGDSGSLALGGLLALVAVISRQEFVLFIIGGAFVLEGLSALISARILVRFFRRFLSLERYGTGRGFVHTEFPLPFLATPMHHHYDLLGWDRKRLVYGAWLLGAGLGLLGVASSIGTFTWERYLARFAALLVIIAVWQSGPWTRSYFIGVCDRTDEIGSRRVLALFYGFPFRLFGKPLFSRVDVTEIDEQALDTPAERLTLWQRMSGFDARSMLGYYCYRTDAIEDALRIWSKIPRANLDKRPEIAEMLAEVRHRAALEADGAPRAPGEGALPATSAIADLALSGRPAITLDAPPSSEGPAIDPNASAWRAPMPPLPLNGGRPAWTDNHESAAASSPFWTADAWAAGRALDTTQSAPPEDGASALSPDLTGAETTPGDNVREAEPATEISGARNPQP